MKRISCLLLLFFVFAVVVMAQGHAVESRVLDASTGEPVPFATVRVLGGASTIANESGGFAVEAALGDTLQVTSVGYVRASVAVGDVGPAVRLQPADVTLGGVTILSGAALMEGIVRKAKASAALHDKERSTYLYRQTTEVDGNTTSLVEAFVDAASAFSLRDFLLVAGRYSERSSGGLMPHMSNLFPLSGMGVVDGFGDNPLDVRMPLSLRYVRHYDVSRNVLDDGNRSVHALRFSPRGRSSRAEFAGSVYVDASTLLPLKVEGVVRNAGVMMATSAGYARTWLPLDVSFVVNYDISGGYCEVQTVYVAAKYAYGQSSIRFSSLMYNVGDIGMKGIMPARPAVDLRRQIDRLGYDAAFWADKEIVMRTGAEAAMARLFDGGDGNPDGNSDGGKAVVSVGKGSAALDSLRRFVGNIDAFNRLFPQEKVYLHFDNTGYFRGETMWFSAYVVRADRRALTDMSRVLYVELLDPTGEVVQARKVRLEDGRGSGSFKLDKLHASGFYEVRAYTRYMLNWDAAWAFSRVLPVFDAPKREGDYSRPAIAEPVWRKRLPSSREADTLSAGPINVAFYPEGGRLVQGLPSRVAFAVTDGGGRPMDCTGRLTLADGTGADVKTLREGRGAFAYTPTATPAKLTIADGRGRERTFSLPAADASGCVMSVDAVTGDYIDVDIRRTADFREPLALVLLSGGNVDATDIIGGDEQEARRRFARADMADGVSQLALIDGHGRIVAERMVFVPPHGGIDTIRISAAGSLSPCGKVRLEARARPGATFSLSVRDAATDANGVQGDAATWLLLSSDLRGYVYNPGYYLEADDAEHRRAADLLMLVQGWRRYDIGQMGGRRGFARRHPVEDGLYLYGQLRQAKKKYPVGGVSLKATLYNTAGESMGGHAETDSLGHYAFRLPDCEGEWRLLLNAAKGGEAAPYRIGIDRNFSPAARPLSPLETERSEAAAQLLPVTAVAGFDTLAAGLGMEERVHVLKEVKVKGKRLFENARAGWETEQRGAFRSYVRYDCDKAADEIYDQGGETPTIFEWLARKNRFFSGEEEGRSDASYAPDALPDDEEQDVLETDEVDYRGFLSRYGMSYKNRPIVWILNNTFYMGTSTRSVGSQEGDIERIYYESAEVMPRWLDEYKSVYISEDDAVWQHYVESPKLVPYHPVTVFLYSHHAFPGRHKGQRTTHYEGYSKVETFQMPDYSLMPPEADHRRTLYWNPSVTVGKDGRAAIDIYNNSSCRQLAVSAEGIAPDGQPMVYGK